MRLPPMGLPIACRFTVSQVRWSQSSGKTTSCILYSITSYLETMIHN